MPDDVLKDKEGNIITEEMLVDLCRSTGISQKTLVKWLREGFIRNIPGPQLMDNTIWDPALERQVEID